MRASVSVGLSQILVLCVNDRYGISEQRAWAAILCAYKRKIKDRSKYHNELQTVRETCS